VTALIVVGILAAGLSVASQTTPKGVALTTTGKWRRFLNPAPCWRHEENTGEQTPFHLPRGSR
jgi:hypothetical protein